MFYFFSNFFKHFRMHKRTSAFVIIFHNAAGYETIDSFVVINPDEIHITIHFTEYRVISCIFFYQLDQH